MEEPMGREAPPTMPSRGAFFLAFASVVVAGCFGAVIGYGVTDVECTRACTGSRALGSVIGGVIAAVGVGIVAVLVLRAMSEWRRGKSRQQ
jgi:hypothetical protein